MASSVLGDGFIECIPDEDIRAMQKSQPAAMEGTIVLVPVVVAPDGGDSFTFQERVGRFGWKAQDASLMNFSAGAYLNEMGVTSPLQRIENTSMGRNVFDVNPRKDVQDATVDCDDAMRTYHPFGKDVETFARFMRATKAPSVESAPEHPDAVARGKALFLDNIQTGCAACHVAKWTTAKEGTQIGDFKVPAALASKTIEPYTDFMLHNIGSGDGIVQTQHAQRPPHGCELKENIKYSPIEAGPKVHQVLPEMYRYYDEQAPAAAGNKSNDDKPDPKRNKRRIINGPLIDTAPMIKTAPLWGLRTRPQLMHDGLSLTIEEAILRHGKEAEPVTKNYHKLSPREKQDLLEFLGSL